MLILQARNWNSIATEIKKAKQDLGAMSRSDFSQLLCSKSASQRREHDNNYNHFTELSKLHSKIVLCKKEMKIPFLIFSSPPSCGQRHICPKPDLLISKPVEYQMSTSLVGHHRSWQHTSVKIQKQTKTKDTKNILSNQLLVEYHNSTTESFRHRFKELQICRITVSGLLKCYPPKFSQKETLFTRCKLKWQNKGFQSLAEVINLNLEL